jgi:double stranded RNA-specific editase B
MGTIPVSNKEHLQAWDSILLGERLRVMSCSDKLAKYNVTGVQGALLSHLMDTVYMDSIIIGGYYHKKHMERAMYARIEKGCEQPLLPKGFRINKPVLSSITNNAQRQTSKPSNRSLLWSLELSDEFEIINCSQGKKVDGLCSL